MKRYRIKEKGWFMGYKGPAEGLELTDREIALLKLVKCPLEEYEVDAEGKPIDVKPKEEAVVEMVEVTKTEPEVPVIEEPVIEIPTIDVEAASKIDEDDILNNLPDSYESSMDVARELPKPTYEQWEEAVTKHFESEIITEPSFVYTHEMLQHLTIKQMKEVLIRRGHTKMRDPFRGKQLDNRSDLITKIICTNPEK